MTLRQLQKNSEKISDFGGDDGPSGRFFERF